MTPRALWLGLVAVGVLLAGAGWSPLTGVGAALVVVWAAACAADWWAAPREWQVERLCGAAMSLGSENRVELRLAARVRRPTRLTCRDECDPELGARPSVMELTVPKLGWGVAEYVCVPVRRGRLSFHRVLVRCPGPLGLWRRQAAIAAPWVVPVYPALRAIGRWESLVRRGGVAEMGVRSWRRYGEGTEFAGIREYVDGDDPRRVNWRATARLGRAMTSQYEPERSRPVWLVLDCGRLMAAGEEGLTKLDVALASALLLAWVALFRGDRVGAVAVAEGLVGLAPPRSGRSHYQRLLEGLSGLRPHLVDPDWELAITELRRRPGPRALVVTFTDLADPALSERLAASLSRLRPHHLPLVVTQTDPVLERELRSVPNDQRSVLRRAAALQLLGERRSALARLEALGVFTVDSGRAGVGPAVINRYLELKARGAL